MIRCPESAVTDALGTCAAAGREADWRFLLPAPSGGSFEHLLLLGGSAALARTVLDLGVARHVSRTIDAAGVADAVVVLAGARESIDGAVRSLRQDGALYWEIDRRVARQLPLTPARAISRLRRSGVVASAAYWVKPGFPQRQMYLPVGAAGAFRWYLDTLYRSTSVPRRILKAGLHALTSSGAALGSFAPCYAVTGARGTPRPASIVGTGWHDGARSIAGMDPVFLAHGTAEWSRIAVLLFEAHAPSPTVALKFPRRAAFNQQVEWEHRFLREVGGGLPAGLRRSLPWSSLFHWNDLSVCLQSCVAGATLSSRAGADAGQLIDDLHAVARWLAEFHRATRLETAPAHQWLAQRLVAELCTEYEATFGLTSAERHLFATLTRRLDATDAGLLPVVWQHTDFGPWNVYRDGNHLSVIDWEAARRGPPLVDLLYFAAHWSTTVAAPATEEWDAHFASLFCDPRANGMLVGAIHREIAEYMRRLHIPSSLFGFLLVYTVLEQALDRARRFAAFECADATEHADNRYVRYLRVLAQHAGTLFPEELPHAA
jgi:aminoglycoside phosphotransferase (APT) family kinase protein